ncbi:septation protein SepH [Nesterenkonia sp. PF2B19]|uniref:septation protein SepH n=1 Tax=Nesterenkonia sp. PF2B19 TaxID=1881858 RepID=UPI000872D9EB|nr:septation protein SepH [Nesterenkonia sp. PF2B19]OSM43877.1 hypothetical protein BCY76_005490 [Nesterenkonia sp. PF2B19]
MQQLRIMGVTEDDSDELLVLADDQGQEFALPVDDALRAAVGRKSTRPPHLTTRAEDARAPMTVREVQARLRAGATVEQMVAESGLDPARVERYAGPVQAERAYVAELARSTAIAPPSSAEQHRIAFGDAPATLEAMALVRLRSLGVDLTSLAWDAWRRQDGSWQVVCWFSPDDEAAARARVDAEPPAEWVFSPESRHLRAVGPWAQTLSSLPPETGARRGPRRLTAVDAPFDVESVADSAAQRSDRGTGRPAATTPAPVPADQQDTSPLLPALRTPRQAPRAKATSIRTSSTSCALGGVVGWARTRTPMTGSPSCSRATNSPAARTRPDCARSSRRRPVRGRTISRLPATMSARSPPT